MAQHYNPIVRTFGRFRAGLVAALGVPRDGVHPAADLEDLIPAERRREVWRSLRRQGLRVPPLELPRPEGALRTLLVLKTAATLAFWLGRWSGLLLALPLGLLDYWLSRRRAVCFPFGLRTVGEMVLCLTSFPEHRHSGYRWTRNEIAFRVRLTLAEALNLPLDAVREECKLAELGAE